MRARDKRERAPAALASIDPCKGALVFYTERMLSFLEGLALDG